MAAWAAASWAAWLCGAWDISAVPAQGHGAAPLALSALGMGFPLVPDVV